MNQIFDELLYFREKYLSKIRGFYHEGEIIKVLTGVRRCGKSSILKMIVRELLSQGVKKENILFLIWTEDRIQQQMRQNSWIA